MSPNRELLFIPLLHLRDATPMMVIVLVRVSIAGKRPVTLPTLITLTEVAAYSFRGLLHYHCEWEHGAGEGTAIY